MNNRFKRSNPTGFMLLELLVAIGIFTVAIVGIAVSAISIIKFNKTASNQTIALQVAQDKMEELKANRATLDSGGPTSSTVNGQSFTCVWTVTVDSPSNGVIQIDVTVSWSDYSDQSLTISSAVFAG